MFYVDEIKIRNLSNLKSQKNNMDVKTIRQKLNEQISQDKFYCLKLNNILF